MDTRLFVGVSNDASTRIGRVIAAFTRKHDAGPYVVHGHPATHAFLAIRHPDGCWWRLDGKAPVAAWSPQTLPWEPSSVGLWEIKGQEDDLKRGLLHILRMKPPAYDLVELGFQLVDALASDDGLPHARICTTVAIDGLMGCGDHWVALATGLKNYRPETLARKLSSVEHEFWCRRET
jgi:hypothetical protein